MSTEPEGLTAIIQGALFFSADDTRDIMRALKAAGWVSPEEAKAREAAARREALLEAAEESEMRINLANRVTALENAIARVEALAEAYEAESERHRNAETVTIGDGARAYRAAQRADEVARSIRAALAGGENDAEV